MAKIRDLEVMYRPAESLRPHDRNPRTHSKKQIRQIAESIKAFGWTNPILVDSEDGIIAGHGRVEAAKLLGMASVPTIQIGDLSEAQKRAYIIADNRLAESAGWDTELLRLELQYVTDLDLDFDLTLTGFETAEIDLLLQGKETDSKADQAPEVDRSASAITREGDLWLLGEQRLYCGDATEAESYAMLMDGRKAQMVFTDPPYNVAIDGHVCGLGAVKHREFAMASGEMSEAEFTAFLNTVFRHLITYSADGSIHFVCMDWRHIYELLSAARPLYSELKNLCVWNKDNGGMGSFYRSKHELVFALKNGTAPHINNFELGQTGRYRTNVWDYAGINTNRAGRMEELQMHPTVKPVALVADAIRDCSKRRGIVLDAFAGSGTTIIAAEKTDRIAYALELDPAYVDTAVKRWQDYTGREAVHADSRASFAAVGASRAAEAPIDDPLARFIES
nr:DNA methyltransferase [Nitrosomonas nitrosa]